MRCWAFGGRAPCPSEEDMDWEGFLKGEPSDTGLGETESCFQCKY